MGVGAIRRLNGVLVAMFTAAVLTAVVGTATAGAAPAVSPLVGTQRPATAAGAPTLLALQGVVLQSVGQGRFGPPPTGGLQRFDPVRLPNGPRSTVSITCPGGTPDSMVAAVVLGDDLVGVDGACGQVVVVAGGGTGPVTTHPVGPAYGIARSPDGSLVYILSSVGVSAIDTSTWKVVRTVPVAGIDVTAAASAQVAVDPRTGDVWVDTPGASNTVHLLAATTLAPLSAVGGTGGTLSGSIAFTPGSAWLPVDKTSGGDPVGDSALVRVATATSTVSAKLSFGGLSSDAVASPTGTHVYVDHGTVAGTGGETQLSDVTTATMAVRSVDLLSGSFPEPEPSLWQLHLAISDDGGSVYFSDSVWAEVPGFGTNFDQIDTVSSATDTIVSQWTPPTGTYVHLITGLVAADVPAPPAAVHVVGMAATPDGKGYWEAAADGSIVNFGDAGFEGSAGSLTLLQPVVGMAATPGGEGYWEVAADGGIFASGNAAYLGSTGGTALSAPVVGMAATPDGKGYWLVGADGGIFSFGDAGFFGSTGGTALSAPVVGMAATPDGKGYWLVGADGGVFTFGDAGFFGSTGGTALSAPIVGMAATPDGKGYWLVGADGGIFTFGDAGYHGSVVGAPLA